MTPILKATKQITEDLDAWNEHMLKIGENVPDFWDELNTSERLGEWLAACGYRRAEASLIYRPGDVITVLKSG